CSELGGSKSASRRASRRVVVASVSKSSAGRAAGRLIDGHRRNPDVRVRSQSARGLTCADRSMPLNQNDGEREGPCLQSAHLFLFCLTYLEVIGCPFGRSSLRQVVGTGSDGGATRAHGGEEGLCLRLETAHRTHAVGQQHQLVNAP